jgi:hypothetical protein
MPATAIRRLEMARRMLSAKVQPIPGRMQRAKAVRTHGHDVQAIHTVANNFYIPF